MVRIADGLSYRGFEFPRVQVAEGLSLPAGGSNYRGFDLPRVRVTKGLSY